jgi:hypothetical protein
MLPDPDSPDFYVYAETQNSEGNSQELMDEYVELVKSLIEDQAMLSS